jgi:hypothetical protein
MVRGRSKIDGSMMTRLDSTRLDSTRLDALNEIVVRYKKIVLLDSKEVLRAGATLQNLNL